MTAIVTNMVLLFLSRICPQAFGRQIVYLLMQTSEGWMTCCVVTGIT